MVKIIDEFVVKDIYVSDTTVDGRDLLLKLISLEKKSTPGSLEDALESLLKTEKVEASVRK